ncbi:hypothetical protein HK101_009211 [Irineochytrium annulatum]|nr:hypothetical protein HK101_009211 [Irineochytrium annulatum]
MPYATVGVTRGDRVKLYYERHGEGDIKILLIMGLNVSMQSWDYQYDYFGALEGYSCVAFDNRGVGHSEATPGRYTTSQMAKDAYELLTHELGWKENVHVCGVSMGGMIALELTSLCPELVASLTLVSTHAGMALPPTSAIYNVPRLLMIRDLHARMDAMKDVLFPDEWLRRKSKNGEETNAEMIVKVMRRRASLSRIQSPQGAVSQLLATFTHYVSPARLEKIKRAEIPILVCSGTWDNLVSPANSVYLAKVFGVEVKARSVSDLFRSPCRFQWFQGAGHALPSEVPEEFNAMLKDFVDTNNARDAKL